MEKIPRPLEWTPDPEDPKDELQIQRMDPRTRNVLQALGLDPRSWEWTPNPKDRSQTVGMSSRPGNGAHSAGMDARSWGWIPGMDPRPWEWTLPGIFWDPPRAGPIPGAALGTGHRAAGLEENWEGLGEAPDHSQLFPPHSSRGSHLGNRIPAASRLPSLQSQWDEAFPDGWDRPVTFGTCWHPAHPSGSGQVVNPRNSPSR